MEERIKKEDLVDIQKEINEVYYDRADAINKKHSINQGLKKSCKNTGIMLILSILASILPLNIVSVIVWILTAIMSGTLVGYCVAKYNNHTKREELNQKIEELEQLQKDMAIDYNLKSDVKINARLLPSATRFDKRAEVYDNKSNTNNI